uniref:Uncharacterized protein n=1 Tax=Aegilops tauschii TaxID=37682 RepID=M8B5A8_AEGTA
MATSPYTPVQIPDSVVAAGPTAAAGRRSTQSITSHRTSIRLPRSQSSSARAAANPMMCWPSQSDRRRREGQGGGNVDHVLRRGFGGYGSPLDDVNMDGPICIQGAQSWVVVDGWICVQSRSDVDVADKVMQRNGFNYRSIK